MNSVFDTVLAPLEWIVAWLMVGFHTNFSAVGPPAASGLTWGLSIVGLVIVIRIVLIPVCVVMIVLVSASQFASMRQLMMKNMPASALDNPFRSSRPSQRQGRANNPGARSGSNPPDGPTARPDFDPG